jgi:hypothetical protein
MCNDGVMKTSFDIHKWVQTIAIVIAAIWAVYTFIYKEIYLPNTTPVNVSTDLDLKVSPIIEDKTNTLIPVQLNIKIRNPSSREIKLLPSVWFAYGREVIPVAENEPFSEELSKALTSFNESYAEKHAKSKYSAIVAAGRLFRDEILKPKEILERTVIFHVPVKKYDVVEALVIIPSAEFPDLFQLEWAFDDEYNTPRINIYTEDSDGSRTLQNSIEGLMKAAGFARSTSTARISILRE